MGHQRQIPCTRMTKWASDVRATKNSSAIVRPKGSGLRTKDLLAGLWNRVRGRSEAGCLGFLQLLAAVEGEFRPLICGSQRHWHCLYLRFAGSFVGASLAMCHVQVSEDELHDSTLVEDLALLEAVKSLKDLIQHHYYEKEWTELDWRLHEAWQWLRHDRHRSTHDIRNWPNDMVKVFASDSLSIALGSLAAVMSALSSDGPCPDVVVSMNAEDPQRQGEPENWSDRLRARGACHLRFPGYDEQHLTWGSAPWHARKQEFTDVWLNMVGQLKQCIEDVLHRKGAEDKMCHVLIHCWWGVNRSTAAICAVLMNLCGLSLRRALTCVLKERASLKPLQNRDYMFVGLLNLEMAWKVRDQEDKMHDV